MGSQVAAQTGGILQVRCMNMDLSKFLRTFSIAGVALSIMTTGSGIRPGIVQAAEAVPELVINEINWAGSPEGETDQWVEIYNPTDGDINLATQSYRLDISQSGAEVNSVDLNSGTIRKHGYYLLASLSPAGSSLKFGPDKYMKFSLPAKGMFELRRQIDETSWAMVDRAGNGTDAMVAGSVEPFASMERANLAVDGGQPAAWRTSTTVGTGLLASSKPQYGTPQRSTDVNGDPVISNPLVSVPTGLSISPDSPTTSLTPTVKGHVEEDGIVTPVTDVEVTYQSLTVPANVRTFTVPVKHGEEYKARFESTAALTKYDMYQVYVVALDKDGNRSARQLVPVAGSVQNVYVINRPEVPVLTNPVLDAYPAITNQPTVTLTGTAGIGNIVVSINGEMVMRQTLAETQQFSLTVGLMRDKLNVIEVRAYDPVSLRSSEAAVASIVQDSLAPVLDKDLLSLASNRPGVADTVTGKAGAVTDTNSATVSVYSDEAKTKLVGSAAVKADGSFDAIEIGDNAHAILYVVSNDAAGNASEVVTLENPVVFTVAGGIPASLVASSATSLTVSWTPVPGAVGYHVKYRSVGGEFGTVENLCFNAATCSYKYLIDGLKGGVQYVVALSAVDMYGNESMFTETTFTTPAVAVSTASYTGIGGEGATASVATTTSTAPNATGRVTRTTTTTPTPTPTITGTPTPTPEKGEVKSAQDDKSSRNWTPWIILAILVGLAILATTGYFYWFGGEAGEEAIKSAQAERDAEAAKSTKKETPPPAEDKKPKGKRW